MESNYNQRERNSYYKLMTVSQKYFIFAGFIVLGIIALVQYSVFSLAAGTNANVEGYAWSSNYGWISFHGENYRVNIINNEFANGSYAWSPNVGWIAFGSEQLGGCPTAPCVGKITQVGTQRYVSGWAKVLSTNSWVSLSGENTNGQAYGVVIQSNGAFTGYAWDGVALGWVSFQGVTSGGGSYGVYTDAITLDDVNISNLADFTTQQLDGNGGKAGVGGGSSQDCAFYSEPSSVPALSKTTLYWYCQSVTSCSLDGTAVTVPSGSMKKTMGKTNQTYTLSCQGAGGSKNYTTQVKVITAVRKEVKPQ